jgi:hypothetical protein
MSGHTPFAALNSRENYYVKALYYVFGYNDLVDMLPGVPAQMKADAIEFAQLYSEQFAEAESVINIQDCFKMFLAGKKVFKRE